MKSLTVNLCVNLDYMRFMASFRVYPLVSHTRSAAGKTYIQALNRNTNKSKNNSLLCEVHPYTISY